ncbi:phosphotransferase [Streptomyces sp. B93]|nr:phosphotransferase [Streptomyces sp. B93]
MGEAAGRLHCRLAEHPAARPELRAGSAVCDLRTNRARHERLIAAYGRKPALGGFEAWALEAARERQGLWGKLGRILGRPPELTFQILHSDLASPNLLLHGAQVAAIIRLPASEPALRGLGNRPHRLRSAQPPPGLGGMAVRAVRAPGRLPGRPSRRAAFSWSRASRGTASE